MFFLVHPRRKVFIPAPRALVETRLERATHLPHQFVGEPTKTFYSLAKRRYNSTLVALDDGGVEKVSVITVPTRVAVTADKARTATGKGDFLSSVNQFIIWPAEPVGDEIEYVSFAKSNTKVEETPSPTTDRETAIAF